MDQFERLLQAAKQVIRAEQERLADGLPDVGKAVTTMESVALQRPAISHCPNRVGELLAAVPSPSEPHLAGLLDAVRDAAPVLQWTDPYAHEPDQQALRAGYFVTTLVGSRARTSALAFDDNASVFLTVQAPHLLYPLHSHLAPELYCAIAGTADWKKGDQPFESKPPGSWMVHPPWMSHAMQTRDEPLVALAIWTADLDSIATLD